MEVADRAQAGLLQIGRRLEIKLCLRLALRLRLLIQELLAPIQVHNFQRNFPRRVVEELTARSFGGLCLAVEKLLPPLLGALQFVAVLGLGGAEGPLLLGHHASVNELAHGVGACYSAVFQ